MSNRDAAADLDVVKKQCDFCHGEGAFETAIHGVHDVCLECHGTGRDEPTECLEIAEYWIERAEHLEAENEELRAELSTLKEGTYCAYCGFTVASDADGSVIANHIRTCERHPMRDVEAENERLRAMQRYAPRAARGFWKWLSEFEGHISCPEVLPRPMFDSLRGYDELESSSSSRAYLSREDAMNALQAAFDAVAKQQQ